MSGRLGSDELYIEDLEVYCVVGLNDWEREARQRVVLNIRLEVDTRRAALSGALADSVNYRSLTKKVLEFVEGSAFDLIETLAQRVADICLEEPNLSAVELELSKPGALRHARSVGIRIRRERGEGRGE